MLELRAITAGYDRRSPVVRDVSLTVQPGEAVGLLGPSGCGKSTLGRVVALPHRPGSGTLPLDGEPVRSRRHHAPRALRTAFGSSSSSPGFPPTPACGSPT